MPRNARVDVGDEIYHVKGMGGKGVSHLYDML